jgi:hypothetical protein
VSIRNVSGTGGGGGGGGRVGGRGTQGAPRQVGVRELPAEAQRAFELLSALAETHPEGRARVLSEAGAGEPLSQQGLLAVASLYARLDMPLTPSGIARFKADRGLVGGSSLAGSVALAYARALEGGEVLFRVNREEEASLRPADRACLQFLRMFAKTRGAEAVGRLKEALDLGNPPVSDDAAALGNEYIGVHTVREVSKATSMRHLPLTDAGLRSLVQECEARKANHEDKPTGPPSSGGPTATRTSVGQALQPTSLKGAPGRGPRTATTTTTTATPLKTATTTKPR